MRAVVQRVSSASVSVDGKEVGHIGAGLLVLLGVAPDDGPEDTAFMVHKLRGLRIFSDADGLMNRSSIDVCAGLRNQGFDVQNGVFGAHMEVSLVNDGPVTIIIETDSRRKRVE